MNYQAHPLAIAIFIFFVLLVLGLSYYFARKAKSAAGYYAAGGQIHWTVNGIAFAGDYLSAASFLGIAGMIAVAGFDGFLYSIGYLAGWMVALFVVAEPLKRLGKYTFADAIDSKFKSRGVILAAAVSTLIVSLFYLIPQMVGAGSLITPLLGLPFEAGVLIVGIVVIIIVSTAGMTSTTWVQFIKGGLLVLFSIVVVVTVLANGLQTKPQNYHDFTTLEVTNVTGSSVTLEDNSYNVEGQLVQGNDTFVKLSKDGVTTFWQLDKTSNLLTETQTIVQKASGDILYNGEPRRRQVLSGRTSFGNRRADRCRDRGPRSVYIHRENPGRSSSKVGQACISRRGRYGNVILSDVYRRRRCSYSRSEIQDRPG
jgi:cation/acetate symporter